MGRKAFAASTNLTLGRLVLDSVLPAKTHLEGQFKQFKVAAFVPDPKTGLVRKAEPKIELNLECELLKDAAVASDYAPPMGGNTATIKVNIVLWPRDVRPGDEVGEEIKEMLRGSMKDLKESVGRQVTINTGGMAVVDVTRGAEVTVTLRGEGERVFKVKGRNPIKLLQESVAPSATPGWLGTPASEYATPADDPGPVLSAPPVYPIAPGMKPLSSHQIPKMDKTVAVPKRPESDANVAGPSAPMKRTGSGSSLPTKRPRIEQQEDTLQNRNLLNTPQGLSRNGFNLSSYSKTTRLEQAVSKGASPRRPERPESMDDRREVDLDITSSTERAPKGKTHASAQLARDRISRERRSRESSLSTGHPTPQSKAGPSSRPVNERTNAPATPSQLVQNGITPTRVGAESRPQTIDGKRSGPALAGSPFNGSSLKQSASTGALSVQSARSETSGAVRARWNDQDDPLSKKRREAEARARQAAEEKHVEKEKGERAEEQAMEALNLPMSTDFHSYDTIETLHDQTKANVMGVVVEVVPPKTGHRDSWMTLIIADPTSHKEGRTSDDFGVTLFRPNVEELPRTVSPGTPMLFRGLKIKFYNNKLKGQAFSNDTNTWALLSGGQKLRAAKVGDMDPPIGNEELDRLTALHKWWTAINGPTTDTGYVDVPDGQVVQKDAYTLGQVTPRLYFDGTFKIMHVVINERRGKKPAFELYVSDGTVNPQTTRNFHQIDAGIPPSALFCLAVQDPDDLSDELFQKGNVIKMRNIRVKEYQGDLELAWGNLQVRDSEHQGWNNKKSTLIDKGDHRVQMINTRINQLKRGKIPALAPRVEAHPVPLAAEAHPDFATNIGTIHTDPVTNPISSLAKVSANTLIPNRFRVQARVSSLHKRSMANNPSYLQKHCGHCNRGFTEPYCRSCNDERLASASIVYRFIAVLEQDDVKLPMVIADEEAEMFLPRPPTIPRNQSPGDLRKLNVDLKKLSEQVDHILLGPRDNGQRTRPIIDWSLETIEVQVPGKEECIIVTRPFGMERRVH